jgi:hypothetical protein
MRGDDEDNRDALARDISIVSQIAEASAPWI